MRHHSATFAVLHSPSEPWCDRLNQGATFYRDRVSPFSQMALVLNCHLSSLSDGRAKKMVASESAGAAEVCTGLSFLTCRRAAEGRCGDRTARRQVTDRSLDTSPPCVSMYASAAVGAL